MFFLRVLDSEVGDALEGRGFYLSLRLDLPSSCPIFCAALAPDFDDRYRGPCVLGMAQRRMAPLPAGHGRCQRFCGEYSDPCFHDDDVRYGTPRRTAAQLPMK